MGDAEESFSLRQSSVQKAPSKSRSNYERADGGKKGGGGGSKKIGLPQILAIVAIIITLVALVLAIYCALLWWFWPLVLALPALTLAIVAIILAFVASSHIEAIIVCSALGIIFGFCGLVWGAVEIALCHSYQGPLDPTITYEDWLADIDDIKGKDEEYRKAEAYHNNELLKNVCKGRCYDWFYRRQIWGSIGSCKQATQDEVEEEFLTKGEKVGGKKINNCNFEGIAPGVDTIQLSPIYLTHMDYYEGSRQVFAEGAKDDKSSRETALGEYCDKFDVTKFVEQRGKCDAKLEKIGEFSCRMDFASMVFDAKPSKCKEIPKIKECKMEGEGPPKFYPRYILHPQHHRLRQQDHYPDGKGGDHNSNRKGGDYNSNRKGGDYNSNKKGVGSDGEGGSQGKVYHHSKYIQAMGGYPECLDTDSTSVPGTLPPEERNWGRCYAIIE